MLTERRLDPARVSDPAAAWEVFRAFLAVDLAGLETAEDADADGFAVSWGRYGWNDRLPSLSFERILAVDVSAAWTETEHYQPEYWRVGLEMVFAEHPGLADVGGLKTQDSGVYYERPGPAMDDALREALWEVEREPSLRILWAGSPSRSIVKLEPLD
ncbi:hypothetical protein AB0I28_05255 [Phytomonospora sp. NPDC050363]|uniref:hypothetical protein n=1 Tax=Phytomonospora sp. NPDC050363 TaxID=3155642 RepID=UPI0033E906E4